MFTLVIGIVVGAAFAPFFGKVYLAGKLAVVNTYKRLTGK